jgi:hypothetical protein
MTGGDDNYGDAFKEAKLEHDQRRQGSAEELEPVSSGSPTLLPARGKTSHWWG